MKSVRQLAVIFGDQLNRDASLFKRMDKSKDLIWMAEVKNESEHVWSHKQRIVLFLSAMRHFRDQCIEDDYRVAYTQLDDRKQTNKLSERLAIDLRALNPERVLVTHPGEWRVLQELKQVCQKEGVDLEILTDNHFFTTIEDFEAHASGRKSIRMEFFYRELRKRFEILMDGDKPEGGEWNYDKENRGSFDKSGPEKSGDAPGFKPDSITQDVIKLVEERFGEHPGSLDSFSWPVIPKQAKQLLRSFIQHRLPHFGRYQDALWKDEPWLFHSLISSSLNLKLLNPRQVISAAEKAYDDGDAPLAAVEGFIRQILGWREYVRGIYWTHMPDYLELNEMQAHETLPDFYWTGKTDLECLKQAIGQTLEHGYAHHIQRLMVTGLYSLLLGVEPKQIHQWYLAVYVDAVEWVELPNTLGMSQYGDGGLMASKPYVATGNYINKMSNYCSDCPKNPKKRTGEEACPFTTLYWDYLIRHTNSLKHNQRMGLQLRNLKRLNSSQRSAISQAANKIRENPSVCYTKTDKNN